MLRRAPPPDFRYVWLGPGPSSVGAAVAAGTIGLAGVAIALWGGGDPTASVGVTLLGSAMALAVARGDQRLPVERGAREVTMAIVPWGVLVTPETEMRVLRWPAVRRITVDVAHAIRGGTPSILSSLVTVQTDREVLAGRTSGAVDLERLVANLDAYAAEAARPIAGDLEGEMSIGDGVTEPIGGAILQAAEELCATSRGAARLSLPNGGYRTAAARIAAPETVEALREALGASAGCAADPRPLAAVLAGGLGARELVPDLLRLASSPHPVVAAFAKAAALRLGAPRNRAGSLEEVEAFLCEEDVALGQRWSEEGEGGAALSLRVAAEAC